MCERITLCIVVLMGLTLLKCTAPSDEDNSADQRPAFYSHIAAGQKFEQTTSTDSTLWHFKEARRLADSMGSSSDRALISGILGRYFLYRLGKVDTAGSYLAQQREILEAGSDTDTSQLVKNYIDLSFLHVKRLELPFARSYAEMALDLAQNSEPIDSVLISEVYIALGHVTWYGLEEEREQSLNFYHLAMQHLPSGDTDNTLRNKVLIGLINVFNNIPRIDSSTFYLKQFYHLNQNNGHALAEYYRLYGICSYMTAAYARSASDLEKAVALYRKQSIPDLYSTVGTFLVLSAAYQYNHQFTKALASVDSALIRQFGSVYDLEAFQTDIVSIGLYASRAEILADSAMHYNDTALALQVLNIYKSIDTLRRHFIKLDIDTYLHQQFYDNYTYWKPMEINSFLYNQTGAEKWLYRIHELISAYKAQGFNRDKILSQLYHSPHRNAPSFQKYIRNDLELEEATQAKDFARINILSRQRQEIIQEISRDIPEVIDRLIHTRNLSAEELLRYTIDSNKAVINYYIGNPYYNLRKIYVLIAVNGRFKLQILDKSPEILTLTDTLYKMHVLAASGSVDLDTTEYYQTGYTLYETLFSQTQALLEGMTDLIIIPDQKLHTLSFEGLITQNPKASGNPMQIVSNSSYLIESFNIVYAHSPNDLWEDSVQMDRRYPLDMLVMAYSSKETLFANVSDSIPELNSSFRELEVIKMLYGSNGAKYFPGYDCTKSNFLKYAEDAEIIHISTHGAYDSLDRTSSVLYLRKEKKINKLYQHELRYQDIRPRLLVLSACDSGAGKRSNEEGMFSIGRTFQAFGAEEAITALWPLSGNASAEFFELFYRNFLSIHNAATSLRNAKLRMIRTNGRYSLPGYWCSLVMHQ